MSKKKEKISINTQMEPIDGAQLMHISENFHKLLTKLAQDFPNEEDVPKGNLIYGMMLLASEIHALDQKLDDLQTMLEIQKGVKH